MNTNRHESERAGFVFNLHPSAPLAERLDALATETQPLFPLVFIRVHSWFNSMDSVKKPSAVIPVEDGRWRTALQIGAGGV